MSNINFSLILNDLINFKLPEKDQILQIIDSFIDVSKNDENLIRIYGNTYIFGDIHGQFYDLINMMKNLENSYNIVFLGDFVDRGFNSIEVILYVFLLKIIKPNKVFLIRGNHENRMQTSVYGFQQEVLHKSDLYVYWRFCDAFHYLVISCIVNDLYFCIHGGITPKLTLKKLLDFDRLDENFKMLDVMWSDPTDECDYFSESTRGAGYLYGKNSLIDFLKEISCKYLIRSHQLVLNGIKEDFEGKCITVWSAPNYVYVNKNKAAIVKIEGEKHTYLYFDWVEKQYNTDEIPF